MNMAAKVSSLTMDCPAQHHLVRQWATPLAASRYSIVASEMPHVYALAARMRKEDAAEIESAGLNPLQELRRSYKESTLRRTAFVDGEIAAMWGLGGTFMSAVGVPWLLTTPAAARVPLAYIKEAKVQIAVMLTHRRYLENYVAASYVRACRFLSIVGFTLEPPQPFGPNGALFHRFWMGTPPPPSKDH